MNCVKKIIATIILLSVPFAANANMLWPSLYIVQTYYVWYVILAALIVEIIGAHMFLKIKWSKAILTMFVTNLISALLGLLLIPASGILIELLMIPFGGGTFDIMHWILDYLCAVLLNTLIEGYALQRIFHYPLRQNFRWLFVANLISVLISLSVLFK